MQFSALCSKEVVIHKIPAKNKGKTEAIKKIPCCAENPDGFCWSKDGNFCAVLQEKGEVAILDARNDYQVVSRALPSLKGIKKFYFSPKATCLVTAERPSHDDPKKANMKMWHVLTGTKIFEGLCPSLDNTCWPALLFTDDEDFNCIMQKDKGHIKLLCTGASADTQAYRGSTCVIPAQGVCAISLSSSPANMLAVFLKNEVEESSDETKEVSPEAPVEEVGLFARGKVNGRIKARRNYECCICLYDCKEAAGLVTKVYLPKSEARSVSDATMKWARNATAVLVQTSKDVDETGKIYYGTSAVYLVRPDCNSVIKVDCELPVLDLTWCPPLDQSFMVISGIVPAETKFYDTWGKELSSLGRGKKNTIRVNPFGRHAIVGGFGNFLGDIEFWDLPDKKVIGRFRADCTVDCSWGADGRTFMTFTSHPRMRVDNNIRLLYYDGTLIDRIDVDVLYSAQWRPQPNCFQDEPASPRVLLAEKDAESNTKKFQARGSSKLTAMRQEAAENEAQKKRGKKKDDEKKPPGKKSGNAISSESSPAKDAKKDEYPRIPISASKVMSKQEIPQQKIMSVEQLEMQMISKIQTGSFSPPRRPLTPAEPSNAAKGALTSPPPPPPSEPPQPCGVAVASCPEKQWYYRDPMGNVQGPFERKQMKEWNKARYFRPELPISIGGLDRELPFTPLKLLFNIPDGVHPSKVVTVHPITPASPMEPFAANFSCPHNWTIW